MKSLRKTIQARSSRAEQRSLERWEQTRGEGKSWFVFRTALTAGLTVAGATHIFNYLSYGETSYPVFKLISFVLFGAYVASDQWSTMEGKYQNAVHEARAKALSASKNSPDVFN